jgi:hypothetical protein
MRPHFPGADMSSSKRKEKDTSQPPTPPRWKGADSLELVYRLNERSFTLLKEGSTQHRKLWSGLGAEAIQRAARFPFLIVDVYFAHEAWWRSVLLNPQGSEEHIGVSPWPPDIVSQLMSEVLVFAWHTARWDRRVARLVLGMVPGVGELVRELTPQHLDAVSRRRSGALRLRWLEEMDFWTRLVEAARHDDETALADIHLHAKLLLSGDLMARSTSKVSP